jgi:acyl carrier protein
MSDADDTLERARRLLAQALGVAPAAVAADASLASQPEWDSLAHVLVIESVEEQLQRRLDPAELVAIRELADIARLLRDG